MTPSFDLRQQQQAATGSLWLEASVFISESTTVVTIHSISYIGVGAFFFSECILAC